MPDSVADKYDDDAEEPPEIDDVVRAQCVTLEDHAHTEYDYGYENNNGYDDDWLMKHKRRHKRLKSLQ